MIHPRTLEDDSVLPHYGSENFQKEYGKKIVDSRPKSKRIQSLRFYRPRRQGKVISEVSVPQMPMPGGASSLREAMIEVSFVLFSIP